MRKAQEAIAACVTIPRGGDGSSTRRTSRSNMGWMIWNETTNIIRGEHMRERERASSRIKYVKEFNVPSM